MKTGFVNRTSFYVPVIEFCACNQAEVNFIVESTMVAVRGYDMKYDTERREESYQYSISIIQSSASDQVVSVADCRQDEA